MLFSFYTPTWQESVIIAVRQFKENCPPGRGTSVESVSERSGGGGISTTMGKRCAPLVPPPHFVLVPLSGGQCMQSPRSI